MADQDTKEKNPMRAKQQRKFYLKTRIKELKEEMAAMRKELSEITGEVKKSK